MLKNLGVPLSIFLSALCFCVSYLHLNQREYFLIDNGIGLVIINQLSGKGCIVKKGFPANQTSNDRPYTHCDVDDSVIRRSVNGGG